MDVRLVAFERLLNIMDDLRSKCPWDMKQTMLSLRNLTIEETYELSDAILQNDLPGIKEELGDVMLHLVFYAKIASETNQFDITDALNTVCDKLIARHPHIYGDVVVADEAEVKRNWEKLKLKEGKKSVLGGVPSGLPAIVKAYRIQDKAAQVGFDWKTSEQVWGKVQEELEELQVEVHREVRDMAATEDEMGDVLFSLINYARFLEIDPETALERCNQKFKARFEFIEANAPKPLIEMTLTEMEALWQKAKTKL
jgi:XTP/dITP diphosphohydrolase